MKQPKNDHSSAEGYSEIAVFQVGDIICGLYTQQIREINSQKQIRLIPLAPAYVRGVINLRGEIVTIIDLYVKFGLESMKQDSARQKIVVIKRDDESVGLLVDNVKDVVTIDPSAVESPPANISGIAGTFFQGVYKMETELVVLLNIEKIMKY